MLTRSKLPAFVVLGVLLCAAPAQAASLDVHITHLRPTKTVRVSVYNSAETWRKQEAPVATREVAARDVSQTVRIDDLPPGRYAVRVEQTPNHSSIEPISFAQTRLGTSGNKASHGLVTFDRAAVPVGADGARVRVHLFTSSRY
jgi:uncharacterized protein (DUF2141 family)